MPDELATWLLSREAVAQSNGLIGFLCVCYKVTIRERII